MPRRGLLLTAVICLGYTAVRFAFDLDLEVFVIINTSSMVAVYLLGMVAAVRLLTRGSVGWWMAIISCVLVAGLVVLAGADLLIPAILAIVALVVGLIKKRRATVVTQGAPEETSVDV